MSKHTSLIAWPTQLLAFMAGGLIGKVWGYDVLLPAIMLWLTISIGIVYQRSASKNE